ncbi:MAG: PqqD family protein [Bacteroidales bacterium]|nr:PqqD family protein [Bacteroidales bacterium]
MKLKKGYVLRELCGEFIVCPEGLDVLDTGRMFSLNEPAAYLWRQVGDSDFTEDTLLKLLLEEYDVPEQTAREDIASLVRVLEEFGVVEE